MIKKRSRIILISICITLLFTSGSRLAQIQNKPNIPLRNASDALKALNYMMTTGDYSIVNQIIGPAYSGIGGPPDAEVTSADPMEHVRVALEASQRAAANNVTAFCVWVDGISAEYSFVEENYQPPGTNSLLQVVYANSGNKEIKQGSAPKFIFARNPQDDNNWTLMEINYFHKGFNYGNPYIDTLPYMSPCPETKEVATPIPQDQAESSDLVNNNNQYTESDLLAVSKCWILDNNAVYGKFLKNESCTALARLLTNAPGYGIDPTNKKGYGGLEYIKSQKKKGITYSLLIDSKESVKPCDNLVLFRKVDDPIGHTAVVFSVDLNNDTLYYLDQNYDGMGITFRSLKIKTDGKYAYVIPSTCRKKIDYEKCSPISDTQAKGQTDDSSDILEEIKTEQPTADLSWWDSIVCFLHIKNCD